MLFFIIFCKYCTKNNLLTVAQYSCRESKSTASNLLEFIDDILKCVDNNDNVHVITVNLSKAFDKLSHDELLHKLKCYGIFGRVLLCIKNFLTGRKFNIKLNNFFSSFHDVTISVPRSREQTWPIFIYNLC